MIRRTAGGNSEKDIKNNNDMESLAINPAQKMILESFAASRDEEELNDLMDMLRNFYATRLKREMHRLWDNGTLDQSALDSLAGEHLRTPYRAL